MGLFLPNGSKWSRPSRTQSVHAPTPAWNIENNQNHTCIKENQQIHRLHTTLYPARAVQARILPTDPLSWRGQGWHWCCPEVAGQRRLCQTLRLQRQEDLGIQLLGVDPIPTKFRGIRGEAEKVSMILKELLMFLAEISGQGEVHPKE